MAEFCTICGCGNPQELKNHATAFHVAYAYHRNKNNECISCGEVWPCFTTVTYTDLYNSFDLSPSLSHDEGFYFK